MTLESQEIVRVSELKKCISNAKINNKSSVFALIL